MSKVDAFAYIFLHIFSPFLKCFFSSKNSFPGCLKKGSAARALDSGALVEHHILIKTEQKRGSVDFFHKWPKAGPLGKGQGVR